jgi:hypothetical protein
VEGEVGVIHRLERGDHHGKYSGRQPAMTAFTAALAIVQTVPVAA